MGKRADKARSSQLTGGEGFTYEDVVVAYFLAALLREEAALGQPGYVTRVAVQQDRQGEPMDDVIVDSESDGDLNRLSIQVKRSVAISKSNDDFNKIIAGAVATRAKREFRPGFDRYGFIARMVADGPFQSLQRIIDRAKASPTGAEFANRFNPAGESSKDDIVLRNELLTLIQPADADAEADFYRHFVAHRLDGFELGGDRFTDLSNRLGAVSANGDGPGLSEILCRQVRIGEGTAKVWTRPSLIADLKKLHPLAIAPSYVDDIRLVGELARNSVADIRSDIGGVMIPRDGLVEAAEQTAAAHVFSNICGLPGCGKSVVLKRCVERASDKGPALFLKSDRLEGRSWRTFANAVGLRHQSAVDLLAEIGASGSAVLFIDGIDRIKPEQRGIVTDLLHTIESNAALRHWRVLVTSRDQGLEVLRSWIPASLYAKTGVGNVSDEAALLAKFLMWFQAERTIPNPLLLQNPSTALEGSVLMRAADQWGWPSDVDAWKRVLAWVFVRHSQFPAVALPLAVELFAVWQNMCGDLQNGFSERIIALANTWLGELEDENPTRWQGLRTDTREAVEKALRNLILRSARAYPEPAQRMIDRVIGVERRGKLFELIMGFSPLLAQICPDKLAQLVLAEVIKSLPKEELEEERRTRDAGNARRAAIRAKPEVERTEQEKDMLSGLFMSFGMKTYDFDDTGIDRMHGFFYPPSPAHEPFASLFQYAPDVARALVRTLSNQATKAWLQIHEINALRYGTPLPLDIDFPWGRQRFWGDQRRYAWYFGGGGPQPLEAAFLTMTHWAHKSLEEGRNLDELIREVVEDHDSVAALGLAVSLALEKLERSPVVFSLISSQRLWHLDFRRQIEESAREINLFGFDPRDRMNLVEKTADAYLKARSYRQRSLKDLSYLFALSEGEGDKTKFREALQRFPAQLPYEYEEQKGDDGTTAALAETAKAWSNFWKIENYGFEPIPDQPGMAALIYSDPEPVPPAIKTRREESAKNLQDMSVVTWATNSFQHGKIEERISLRQAIKFAQSRDSAELLDVVAEAGTGMTQNCVVAAAAMAARFSDEAEDREWGWSVMDRVTGITEREGHWRYSKNSYDPRFFYMAVLKGDLAGGTPRADSAAHLFTLAGGSNPYIAQFALAALLDAEALQPELVWNAAVLATELFIAHLACDENGNRDGSVQEAHRKEATDRALARLGDQGKALAPLTIPPSAWARQAARGKWRQREERWTHPATDFDPYFAKDVIGHFPIEGWAASAERREALLQYADELVRWTVDRLFPSWEESRERERGGTQLYEWLSALATFVARVAILAPDGYARFIEPITTHKERAALTFVSDVTEAATTRFVYDAAMISDEVLALLGACMDRMLAEHTFNQNSYRAGDVNTSDLYPMVRSFLLVSVKNALGAARFANGEWADLPRLLPLIEKLMMAAGWSAGVMDAYLLLCERAGANFPIEIFTLHVSASMDANGFRQESWTSSGTLAGVSSAIQRLAEAHYPLARDQARGLLILLDRLVDMGDRRAAALQQSEHFRSMQIVPKRL